MSQLRRGARQALEYINADLDSIEDYAIDNPQAVRKLARRIKERLRDEIEPMLRRPSNETSIEARLKALEDEGLILNHVTLLNPERLNLNFVKAQPMRYGENPHQHGVFYGNLGELFEQLNGKDLSYNNLVDVDAAMQIIAEFTETTFGIIKHTNVCGIASRATVKESWDAALAGDPESAFGGVLVCNGTIYVATANAINEIFFEVLIAPSFDEDALAILRSKKNRILLRQKKALTNSEQYKSVLNGVLVQGTDTGNYTDWKEEGGRTTTDAERADLVFANLVCKHLKSNAIALVKNRQLIGKGCGQTSRIDSLRQSIEKSKQFNFSLDGAVLASDAFFPFDDCVKIAHAAGIGAFIQPGGSIRDKDSIEYCKANDLAMVITGQRHFKH